MLSKIKSIALKGLEGFLVEIQTNISNGVPEFEIVGLPDATVKEAKKRIETAIKNSGIEFPNKKILINLAPADIRKGGSCFDLAMAIGILIALNATLKIDINKLVNTIFIGELSLDGKVNRVNGILPMCIEAKNLGIKRIILPKANANEASIVEDVDIIAISNIEELIKYLNNEIYLEKIKNSIQNNIILEKYDIDFSDVKGQENVKRALEISAAGGHNCLLIGSPGSRKNNVSKKIANYFTRIKYRRSYGNYKNI